MADFEVPDLDNSETDPSCPHRPQPQRRRDGSVFDCQSARNVATRVGPLSMIKGWRHGVRSRSLVGTPGTRFRSTGACFGSAGTCFEDRAGERSLLSQGQFSRKPRRRRDDDYPKKRSDRKIAPLLLHLPAEACRLLSRVGDVGALLVQWPERFRLTARVLLVKIPTLNE